MSGLFSDGDSFMELPDGRIAYCTQKRTWCEVLRHGLALDDCFYYQTHSPNISFDFKYIPSRPRREREELNDEDRCDSCNNPFDSITFKSKKDGSKDALCSDCVYWVRRSCISRSEKMLCNKFASEVETLLYRVQISGSTLNNNPLTCMKSVSCIFPYLSMFINSWERSELCNLKLGEIFRLKCILDSWSNEFGCVNVLEVVNELQSLSYSLSEEADNLTLSLSKTSKYI
uniref:Uncharacterized protein n=1 Tax=viral metagenome TaxID=1070528 RepID=A0A6C0H3D1_9ZZZZ